jgi:hypothetical protein
LGLNVNECIILEAGYMSTTVNHTENIDWIVKEEDENRNHINGIDLSYQPTTPEQRIKAALRVASQALTRCPGFAGV